MINDDLESINQWAIKWHVTFSPPKTKELLVSKIRNKPIHPPLKLDNQEIIRVNQHKHLGLTLTSDLTWKTHIDEIVAKATKRLGILRNLKFKVDRLSLERIYMSFIRPILEYGDIVWDSPMEILAPLESVQLNAARIVTGATARCSTNGLYTETAWQPLAKRRERHRLALYFKIVNGNAPQYLIDLLPSTVQTRTGYNLRNRNDIDTEITRLNCFTYSFFPTVTKLWNSLCNAVKSKPSIEAFKSALSKGLPTKNPLYYFGGRLESCIHARLRIRNSPLKADLFNTLHVIPSPLCPCGSGQEENAEHFFFHCPLYDNQRIVLKNDLLPFVINNVDYLLFGLQSEAQPDNILIFNAVHKFIRSTQRFY
jgi:hypothetical protein